MADTYLNDAGLTRLWAKIKAYVAAHGGGGGTPIDPATAAPLMDGTAAVGTSDKYAREDHVHPTDTSRAAADHTHELPIASASTLGGVKVGDGLEVANDGTLSVPALGDPVDVTGSVSASSGSDATVCLSAQYAAGIYMVSAYVSFPASSSGRRHIHISTTNTGSALDNWSQETLAPSNAQPTIMQLTAIYKRTSTGRWYLRAYQNSGSAQTVSGGIRVLKLH